MDSFFEVIQVNHINYYHQFTDIIFKMVNMIYINYLQWLRLVINLYNI